MTLEYFIYTFGQSFSLYDLPSVLFCNDNTKSLFTPSKPGSINLSKYEFLAFCDSTFYIYLFQLIVRLKPDFNYC